MAYKPSSRPVFDGPTAIRYASVTRHLWGDDAAGRIDDWIHVLTDKIHQLVFGMPPGQGFRHSESFRTVFGADEVLTVLMLTGITASTDQLTAGAVRIAPGRLSDARAYGGALGIYVTTGRLNILIEDPEASPVWFELHPQDGFYAPPGTKYRAFNMGGEPVEYLFGVAPLYHPVT